MLKDDFIPTFFVDYGMIGHYEDPSDRKIVKNVNECQVTC
jgi:hypothetical protein